MSPSRKRSGSAGDLRVAGLLASLAEWQPAPPAHTPGTHPLWTDPHVSAGMLAAHLDPQDDAASRRPATIDATAAWLAGRLPPGARILDLGCGPGLYAERLARVGFRVTGVDFSARSIDYARSRQDGAAPAAGPDRNPVRYLLGDYRTVDLDGAFDAVLLIYLDYGALPPDDARHLLGRVHGWLAPGGLFAFDVPTPAHRAGSERRRDWGFAAEGYWAAGPHAWLSRTLRYPADTYLDEYVVATASEVRCYRVWERCFTLDAIRAELAGAGLAVAAVHGDLTGTPFEPATATTIALLAGAA